MAESLNRIIKEPLKRLMNLEEEGRLKQAGVLGGRQALLMLYKHLAVDMENTQLYDFDDLFLVRCKDEADLPRFWVEFQECRQLAVEPDLFTEPLLRGQLHREIKDLPCFSIEVATWN